MKFLIKKGNEMDQELCEHFNSNIFRNREAIETSENCACFYCFSIFPSENIFEYTRDEIAICPYCQVDSIIGDGSVLDFNNDEFKGILYDMKEYFFDRFPL